MQLTRFSTILGRWWSSDETIRMKTSLSHATLLIVISFAVFSAAPANATDGVGNVCEEVQTFFENGMTTETLNPQIVHYKCKAGYVLTGPPKQECLESGSWDPPQKPVCEPVNKTFAGVFCPKPYVPHGDVRYPFYSGRNYSPGDYITVECIGKYAMLIDNTVTYSVDLQCSQDGKWVTSQGWPIALDCNVRPCESPPEIPHSKMMTMGEGSLTDGSKVYYSCDSGYGLVHPQSQVLVCKDGEWTGDLPSCIPILNCLKPGDIVNGHQTLYGVDDNWQFYNRPTGYTYPIGSRIEYTCDVGFKLLGSSVIVCLQNKLWSHMPPHCVPSKESATYCPMVGPISNGHCFCGSKNDLTYCEPFYWGLRVECVCTAGYKLMGQSTITCQKDGNWDYSMPTCVAEVSIDSKTNSQEDGAGHMSTLAIVVATACSVLGVLLLIMVIMVFRRRKPRPHFSHHTSASTPPPYSRVHNLPVDEHDRVLLIGYENSQVALPSYEEATSSGSQHVSHFVPRSGSGQVGEYRPLPSIPTNFRSVSQSGNGETSNRHSIITTSTMNRDGLSEVFGSLDTVNVSVSDASTAVTVETFDSATSHHSNMSGRATAGSLSSSSGSLATEDAPLLESSQRDNTIDLGETEEDIEDKTEN